MQFMFFIRDVHVANAAKSQCIVFSCSRGSNCNSEFNLEGAVTLKGTSCVRLLGTDFFLYRHLFIYRGLQHAQCRLM